MSSSLPNMEKSRKTNLSLEQQNAELIFQQCRWYLRSSLENLRTNLTATTSATHLQSMEHLAVMSAKTYDKSKTLSCDITQYTNIN